MTLQPSKFENLVREAAQKIFGQPCVAELISGVNVDGVCRINDSYRVVVESTVEKSLDKVRSDIMKLSTVRNAGFAEGVFSDCYMVVLHPPSPQQRQTATDAKIQLLTFPQFVRKYFDFRKYYDARRENPFGSAQINLDVTFDAPNYVPVEYLTEDGHISADEITEFLERGRNIIQIGEFGSGKSKCAEHVFKLLAERADTKFPIAIDLRKCWGLKNRHEIIRRHFDDVGVPELADQAIKAAANDDLIYILDGFDELGSQAWSADVIALRKIRTDALAGLYDIVKNTKSGVLILGREHYFDSQEELIKATGVDEKKFLLVKTFDEFTSEQIKQYFASLNRALELPDWLPKRPLVCEMITSASDDHIDVMINAENQFKFWEYFIDYVSSRDSKINANIDPKVVEGVLVQLSRVCRGGRTGLGPITLAHTHHAFEQVTGSSPVDEAAAMLLRLPGLGRVDASTNDRQFVDKFIVDGLIASDIVSSVKNHDNEIFELDFKLPISPAAINLVNDAIESADLTIDDSKVKLMQKRNCKNSVLLSDFVAISALTRENSIDYRGIVLKNGHFSILNLEGCVVNGITFEDTIFEELNIQGTSFSNVNFVSCMIEHILGVPAEAGLPKNFDKNCTVDQYDSIDTISRIRSAKLSPQHTILTTIIRKTFFQPGSGRMEDALLRGLGDIGTSGQLKSVLGLLLKENVLTEVKGRQGSLYIPQRKFARRMRAMLDKLSHSDDPIWTAVAEL